MIVTTALLADAAIVLEGKLFVHGGAWDRLTVRQLPTVHPSMALALVFRVEYNEALQDIPIVIELLDEDDQPAGPRVEGQINVGHPAGSTRGTPAFVPQALTFPLMDIQRTGGYRFRIMSGDAELASVPFRVVVQRQL